MIRIHTRSLATTTHTPILAGLFVRLSRCAETWRQRRHLAALSDWQLQDIGLTRADVMAEIERPFWQI